MKVLWKYFGLITIIFLAALLGALKVRADRKLDDRVRLSVMTLHQLVSTRSDNLHIVDALYFPKHKALCIEYKDLDSLGHPYISRAMVNDDEDRIYYAIDADDEAWVGSCTVGTDAKMRDVIGAVRQEDR